MGKFQSAMWSTGEDRPETGKPAARYRMVLAHHPAPAAPRQLRYRNHRERAAMIAASTPITVRSCGLPMASDGLLQRAARVHVSPAEYEEGWLAEIIYQFISSKNINEMPHVNRGAR